MQLRIYNNFGAIKAKKPPIKNNITEKI